MYTNLGRRSLFNLIKQMIFFKMRETSVNKLKFIHDAVFNFFLSQTGSYDYVNGNFIE